MKKINKKFIAMIALSVNLAYTPIVKAENGMVYGTNATNIAQETKQEASPGIYCNGEKVENAKIINREGKIYVELKPVLEKLGYKTQATSTTLTLEKNDVKIKLFLGDNIYYNYKTKKEKSLSTKNYICSINCIGYAPKEFFEEELNYKVQVIDTKETGYVGKDIVYNTNMFYYNAPEKAVFIGKELEKVSKSNFDNLKPTNNDKIEIYKDGIVVKGKKIYLTPFNDAGVIYVPGEVLAEAMGAKLGSVNKFVFGNICHTPDNVEITYNDKKLHFDEDWTCYTVNDVYPGLPLITKNDGTNFQKNVNLFKTMEGYILGRYQFYLPINVFEREFNWKFDIKENIAMIPKPINRNRSISEGWVCPEIKSEATGDFKRDFETLSKELELDYKSYEDGTHNQIEFIPYPEYERYEGRRATIMTAHDEEGYYRIISKGYTYGGTEDCRTKEYLDKLEKVHPQILKFFFPTQWEYIHNGIMNDSPEVYGIHNFDGREVKIQQGEDYLHIDISRVGDTLKNN